MSPRDPTTSRGRGRTAALWTASIAASVVLLWLAQTRFGVQLVPDDLVLVDVASAVLAIGLHPIYAVLRAMRLGFALDPIVAHASGGTQARFDRAVLYGSGFVSFLVLLLLPFKLGEASRPILLARGRRPGVGMAEAVAAVGLERVIDGLMICAMLFGGLALAQVGASAGGALANVARFGQGMGVLFLIAFACALAAARAPGSWGRGVARVAAPLGPRGAAALGGIVTRLAETFAALLDARRLAALVAVSLVYWAVTVLQLWAVARACGLPLSPAAAAATVAIIGLSIQLPGGPAQTGTFQVGAAAALSLFFELEQIGGPAHGFVASMFALPLLGAAVMAVPGAVLLARARAAAPGNADAGAPGPDPGAPA
ncbi:MAG: flippase-like domain-containing protein [Nannocystaceae bacterium]|nr:flippase-like domain-containing protein [Nannocystaceae bacterium]